MSYNYWSCSCRPKTIPPCHACNKSRELSIGAFWAVLYLTHHTHLTPGIHTREACAQALQCSQLQSIDAITVNAALMSCRQSKKWSEAMCSSADVDRFCMISLCWSSGAHLGWFRWAWLACCVILFRVVEECPLCSAALLWPRPVHQLHSQESQVDGGHDKQPSQHLRHLICTSHTYRVQNNAVILQWSNSDMQHHAAVFQQPCCTEWSCEWYRLSKTLWFSFTSPLSVCEGRVTPQQGYHGGR